MTQNNTVNSSDFNNIGYKTAGGSSGYLAERTPDHRQFMVKYSYKKSQDIINNSNSSSANDALTLRSEYMIAPLFKLLLGKNAPSISILSDVNQDEKIYIASKFIKNFCTIQDYHNSLLHDKPTISGIEKVITACVLCGDTDIHPGNLGIITNQDTNEYVLGKIDHGLATSAFESADDIKDFLLNFLTFYSFNQYTRMDYKIANFTFSVSTLINEIDIALSISKEQIKEILSNRADALINEGAELFRPPVEKEADSDNTSNSEESYDGMSELIEHLKSPISKEEYINHEVDRILTNQHALAELKECLVQDPNYLGFGSEHIATA